jgi:hypothetical protein
MIFRRSALALWLTILPSITPAPEPLSLSPMPPALVTLAQSMEAQVRIEFQTEFGHKPKSSKELLAWLDQKSSHVETLSPEQKDALVQKFGAVLGQVLLHEFGGSWVIAPTDQGDSPGINLPIGKVAFVFNRAARRIFEADPIGFVSYFETTESYVHNTALPVGVEAKSKR